MFGIRKAFATHHAVLCSVLMSLKLVYHGKRRKGTGNKIHVLFVPEGMDDAGGHAFRHVWKCEKICFCRRRRHDVEGLLTLRMPADIMKT